MVLLWIMADPPVSRWNEAFAPAVWSNWVLVFITLGATIAALFAARAAFSTLELLGEQTKDTKRAVEAAYLSAKAMINSERAWVEISLGPVDAETKYEAEAQGQNTSLLYGVRITNHGRTVARIESFKVASHNVDGPLNLDALNHQTQNYNTLLGVGESVELTSIDVGSLDWTGIPERTRSGIYHFIVKYRDVVDSSGERRTSALFVYNPNREDLERVSAYNAYS